MYVIHNILSGKFVANANSDSADSYTNIMAYIQLFETMGDAKAALCPMNEDIITTDSLTVSVAKSEDDGEGGRDYDC